jgi:MFS family permease
VSQQAPRGTAATAQGILNGVTSSLSSIIGAGLGGQIAGLLSIRALYAVSACLSGIAVGLLALAVLPVAARTGVAPQPARDAAAEGAAPRDPGA